MERALNPDDPIDLAAMQEVDALFPQAPPITPPADFDEAFERLEEKERLSAETAANAERWRQRRRAATDALLAHRLGPGFYRLPGEDAWMSRDGQTKVDRASVEDDLYRRGIW
jgi:hypothetical protein